MHTTQLAQHLSYEYCRHKPLGFPMLVYLSFVLQQHSQCMKAPYIFPVSQVIYGPCMRAVHYTVGRAIPEKIVGYTHFHHRSVLPKWAIGRIPNLYMRPYFFYEGLTL